MSEPTVADDLSLALAIAADADLVSLPRFRAMDLVVETKPDASPVTDADRAVERLVRERIAASRPDDEILGEEYGGERAGGRQWIVDPIDGTANFLRGVPIWGTMIALAIDGVPVVGVVSAPALGQRWWGGTGLGAWTATTERATVDPLHAQPRRLAVSRVSSLADVSLSHGSLRHWDESGRLDELVGITREIWRVRSYGDIWQYMLLAEGVLDAVVELDLKPWDIAAHIPIIEEAGGRFSDLGGAPGPWGGGAIATNGLVHDAILERLRP